MLYTIAVILLILWLLGFVSGYTIGAFIHVLLVIALVLFLVPLLGGRRVTASLRAARGAYPACESPLRRTTNGTRTVATAACWSDL